MLAQTFLMCDQTSSAAALTHMRHPFCIPAITTHNPMNANMFFAMSHRLVGLQGFNHGGMAVAP
jgi:hypothetical protein